MLKKCKVVMLPTNEKATFNFGDMIKHITNEKLIMSGFKSKKNNLFDSLWNVQHLYIISDDEIKEGDWCYLNNNIKELPDYNGNYVIQISKEQVESANIVKDCKKIIATTDSSLKLHDNSGKNHCFGTQLSGNCKHILPQPSQQFIQKYVEEYNKGNTIVDVLVEYENCVFSGEDSIGCADCNYNRNCNKQKLKINSKDNTITIKRMKDSWDKEDITSLCFKMLEFIGKDEQSEVWMRLNYKKWIEENLN